MTRYAPHDDRPLREAHATYCTETIGKGNLMPMSYQRWLETELLKAQAENRALENDLLSATQVLKNIADNAPQDEPARTDGNVYKYGFWYAGQIAKRLATRLREKLDAK